MSRAPIWILYARPVNFSSGSLGQQLSAVDAAPIESGAFMLDVILIAAALGFFALSVAYAVGCDRL
jgi:hypothetical protein